MKTKISFSIITCTKDSADFVLRNIKSVEKQSLKDYEHIFIDGESTDKTRDIIKEFVRKHPRVGRLYVYPPMGISDAFNKGIEKSKGKYLIFLNGDDYFYDKKVLKDLDRFLKKNENYDWVYGKIKVVERNGSNLGIFPNYKIFKQASSSLLKYINFIPHQAVVIKKEVFEKYGMFDTKLVSKMDYDLWLRICRKTKWTYFDRIIANYTIRAGSITSSKEKREENLIFLERVQRRYLSHIEMYVAIFVNKFISLVNKTYR